MEQVIAQELRSLAQSIGELRLTLNALWQRVERLEQKQPVTGSVQGLPYELTVTGIPRFGDD